MLMVDEQITHAVPIFLHNDLDYVCSLTTYNIGGMHNIFACILSTTLCMNVLHLYDGVFSLMFATLLLQCQPY